MAVVALSRDIVCIVLPPNQKKGAEGGLVFFFAETPNIQCVRAFRSPASHNTVRMYVVYSSVI